MISRRSAIPAAIILVLILAIFHNSNFIPKTPSLSFVHSAPLTPADAKPSNELLTEIESPTAPETAVKDNSDSSSLVPQVLSYFDQVFSLEKPAPHELPTLRQECERTKWVHNDVYLQCGGMAAGLTSIMSQVKVCLKMAIETGTGIVLPAMPLRDSINLTDFNFWNDDAYMTYDKWFDAGHLIERMQSECPQMKILHPDQLDSLVPVKFRWVIKIQTAPGFQEFQSYFWAGRTFKAFFEQKYAGLQQDAFLDPERDDSKQGITVIKIDSQFLLFRVTDDPTRQDLRLWNDLSYLIRFKEEPRRIIHELLSQIGRPFYGVHFRVEADTIWSSLENQLSVDLDALDKAWELYSTPGAPKPLIYLACGDQEQIEKFVSAGKLRGWDVTHKWQLAASNEDTVKEINDLAFDFQGAVDMGIMIKSHFFLGITGSAFSSTIGNARDVTGRYRGSSFTVFDDENARTHLFNDGDASAYACCL